MSVDDRAQYLAWYEKQKDKIFYNKEEMVAYCIDDVIVLRKNCCAFGNLFLKLVKMDPFRQVLTISSTCNKVFRTMFLNLTLEVLSREGVIVWTTASLLMLFNG